MGAVHWNNHLLCAIDIETTGLDPEKHEIIEIAIVPLTSKYEVSREYRMFECKIAPGHDAKKPLRNIDPKAMSVNRIELQDLLNVGQDPWRASEMLEHWFSKLELPNNKKILPLAHNWPHEHKFLYDWLGQEMMNYLFFTYRDIASVMSVAAHSPFPEFRQMLMGTYVDTLPLANLINDVCDEDSEKWLYPKVSLAYLCNQLKVTNVAPHTAMGDAVATAECYARMVRQLKLG